MRLDYKSTTAIIVDGTNSLTHTHTYCTYTHEENNGFQKNNVNGGFRPDLV